MTIFYCPIVLNSGHVVKTKNGHYTRRQKLAKARIGIYLVLKKLNFLLKRWETFAKDRIGIYPGLKKNLNFC